MNLRRLPLLLVLWAAPVLADDPIYRWTDKQGVVHYTDDKQGIPKNAKVETTEGDEVGEVLSRPPPDPGPGKSPRGQTSRNTKRSTDGDVSQAPVDPGAAGSATQNDPQDPDQAVEDQWRAAFHQARELVRQAEQSLAQEIQRNELNGMPISAQIRVHNNAYGHPISVEHSTREQSEARIKDLQEQVAKAQRDLDALDREASSAGIPREWRR